MNDLRFALRVLARNPGSTALIVALLALGAGASTTIFSLFDAVLLRPLPVRHPEQLVRMVQQRFPKLGVRSEFPYLYYKALRDRSKTLGTVFAETDWYEHVRMTAPEPAEEITVRGVTPEFFDALGVRAWIGRLLRADDATRNFDTPPAVLSYNFWRKRFGGNRSSVRGQTLAINGHRFAIIGVMLPGFHGLSLDNGPDVRIPLQAYSLLIPDFNVDHAEFELAGRLKPGVSQSKAQTECLTIWRPLMKDYYQKTEERLPAAISELLKRGMEVQSVERGTSILRDNFGDVFRLLMASVSLLVVIVALNVAGLLLARAAARQREMAVRLAIGGTPLRLARQLFAESVLLSAFGAVGGLIIALITMPLAVRSLPPVRDLYTSIVPISLDAGLNGRVFSFLLASSVITTLIFTVSPVAAMSRLSIDRVLRTVRSSSSFRGRQLLITAQIALCTFLLATAGLLVRSFEQLRHTPSGFATDSVATFRCDFGISKHSSGVIEPLIARVREIPGVVSAATSSSGVMREHGIFATVVPAGRRITRTDFMDSNANRVSRDYFITMGMHMLAGRDFIPSDAPKPKETIPVKAIVNHAFVRQFFPGSNGIGKQFGTGVEGSIASAENEIVGVVSDAKYRSLEDPIRPMFYSLETDIDDDFMLNVRTRMRPEGIIQPVRQALASVAPGLALLETGTLAQAVEDTTAPKRITATLASLFGTVATLLAGIGTYGLLAYAVTQRRREIGIRMALGAQTADVAKLIGGQTLAMSATGIAAGLAAALLIGPAIRSLLYGVSPQDPTALAAAAIFVVLIAIAATVGPASDAIQIQPAETLRTEA
jgi:predicted permease